MSDTDRLTDTQRAILTQAGDVVGRARAWTLHDEDVTDDVIAMLAEGYLALGNEAGRYVTLTDGGRDRLLQDSPGHCPPPWRIETVDHNEVRIVSGTGSVLADVLDEDPVPRQEANARLIVQAPDMLARLREAHVQLLTMQAAIGATVQAIAETIAAATGSNL